MTKREAAGIDFETDAIEQRPMYPPKPAGVSIAIGNTSEYLSWGHPLGNNCTKAQAIKRLKQVWDEYDLVFYNAKFDLDVAETHLGLKIPPWERCHDSLYLAFLDDPLQTSLRLGDVVPKYIRAKAWKAGALEQWILDNVPEARRNKRQWAAYIAKAPGNLVATRAKGDSLNALKLFRKLYKQVLKRGMGEAYDRERRLLLPLLKSERGGICVDAARIDRELHKFYEPLLLWIDDQLRRRLNAPELDCDKGRQMFAALESAGKIVAPVLTENGNPSISAEALEESVEDKKILSLLKLRGVLVTCIRTFMRVWLSQASKTGGRVHTQWNQTRQPGGGGARTGRLSSTPNFQNILNPDRIGKLLEFVEKYLKAELAKFRATQVPKSLCRLPLIPQLRSYILPDSKDHVLIVRDYSQQEMRILAHFEDGALCQRYKENPFLDVHDAARDLIYELIGVTFDRRPVKDTGFGLVYGLGVAGLAKKIEQPYQMAQQLRNAYLKAMPGIKDLNNDMKNRAAHDLPIRTWGGREYFCEKPAIIKGRIRTFEYKMINVLIQGSAADNTKEAICRFDETKPRNLDSRFLLTVHDETVASAPKEQLIPAMSHLRESMESVEFDVLMLSEGKYGPNWGNLKKYDDKRKPLK